MISALRRWFGLKCWLQMCGGQVGHLPRYSATICWRCSECGKVKE